MRPHLRRLREMAGIFLPAVRLSSCRAARKPIGQKLPAGAFARLVPSGHGEWPALSGIRIFRLRMIVWMRRHAGFAPTVYHWSVMFASPSENYPHMNKSGKIHSARAAGPHRRRAGGYQSGSTIHQRVRFSEELATDDEVALSEYPYRKLILLVTRSMWMRSSVESLGKSLSLRSVYFYPRGGSWQVY